MSHRALPSTALPVSPESEASALPGEQAAAAATPIARTKRWLALDLLRFLAVILMVQGHVFYEVIADSVRAQGWYGWHGYVHGFTAPIFLFSSGMAFGITTLGKWDAHTHWGPVVAKRMERYVILIGIGYLLHVGVLKLSWVLGLSPDRAARVARVDALQHIGFTLMVAEGLVMLLRRKRLYLGVIAALFGAAVLIAPWIYDRELAGWPVGVVAWLNASTGSLFPLVPWCGFLLGGVLVARFVRDRRADHAPGPMQLALPLLAGGALLIALGKGLQLSGWDPFPEHNYWKASPFFFVFRFGVVLTVLAALCGVELLLQRREGPPGRTLRFVQTVGSETLVIYVAHLILLYGLGVIPGLKGLFERELLLGGGVALVLAVMVAMGALAWVWHQVKRRWPTWFDRGRYLATALIVAAFLLR